MNFLLKLCQKFFDLFAAMEVDIDKVDMFSYLNDKILRLNDLDLSTFIDTEKLELPEKAKLEELKAKINEEKKKAIIQRRALTNVDFVAALPTGSSKIEEQLQESWNTKWQDARLLVTRGKD